MTEMTEKEGMALARALYFEYWFLIGAFAALCLYHIAKFLVRVISTRRAKSSQKFKAEAITRMGAEVEHEVERLRSLEWQRQDFVNALLDELKQEQLK